MARRRSSESEPPTARVPEKRVHRLKGLDQIRVLADPLRIRLLQAFCEESTTKQVADRLGEKPTKLYHHVEALEKVGLIELSRTRQNRGTLEKYYLAVARTFEADSGAFAAAASDPAGEEAGSLRGMVSTIFETTRDELQALIDSGRAEEALEEEGVLSYCEVRASPKVVRELQQRLRALLQSLADSDDDDSEDQQRYRLTLAYFPLPEDDPGR